MAIVQTLDFSDFQNAFRNYGRESQFSQSGLEILFDYLEEFSYEIAQDIELDIIALCCEYEEATFKEIIEMFPDYFDGVDPDDITGRQVENALEQETTVLGIDSDNEIVVFSSF